MERYLTLKKIYIWTLSYDWKGICLTTLLMRRHVCIILNWIWLKHRSTWFNTEIHFSSGPLIRESIWYEYNTYVLIGENVVNWQPGCYYLFFDWSNLLNRPCQIPQSGLANLAKITACNMMHVAAWLIEVRSFSGTLFDWRRTFQLHR